MINQIHCPLCKKELTKVYSTKDYLVSNKTFDILECSDCRLRLTSPFPEKDEIGNYYESDEYISHNDESNSLFNLIYKIVRNYMLGIKRNLVEKAAGKSNGTLLDIGCGAGHFLNSMKENGWDVAGVEASAKARELVKNQFDIDVDSPDDWLNSNRKFDVITCWHSLEHVHEPWVYLEKFRNQLNPNGILVVAMPNYESTDAKKYRRNWAAYDAPRHLYHFTPTSMDRIMFANDFLITGIHRLPFDAFYVSVLSSRHCGKSTFSGMWNGFISWSESLLNKEKCSSLIYIME